MLLKIISFFISKIGAVFNRIARLFYFIAKCIYQPKLSLSEKNKKIWYQENQDDTLRVDYDLNSNSLVFDLGGYKGDWSDEIAARYCCNIYI